MHANVNLVELGFHFDNFSFGFALQALWLKVLLGKLQSRWASPRLYHRESAIPDCLDGRCLPRCDGERSFSEDNGPVDNIRYSWALCGVDIMMG